MPKLIDVSGTPIDNRWQLLPKDTTLENFEQTSGGQAEEAPVGLIVPCKLWLEHKAALTGSGKQIAVWLDSNETADMLKDDLASLPLIALNFPSFMDGRSYSTATLLRQRFQYTGELRAIGDVLRDQLFYMKRCGFSTFDLKDSVKLEDAQKALKDFTTSYQTTVEEPTPLFRRRA